MSAIDFAAETFVDTTQGRDGEHMLWMRRAEAARKHRRKFEKPWMEQQMFAAGQQHAEYNTRTHRVLVPDEKEMRTKRTHDVLMQYVWTVVGALAQDDFRPQFITARDGQEANDRADFVNKALAYGWEEEWDGDEIVHDLLLYLVVYGTGAIRCRVDRTRGPLISDQVPYRDGQPILDPAERAKHMESTFTNGVNVEMGPLHEPQVVWEPLSPWNLLPQPGVDHERNFGWEIVVRPVPVSELRASFPDARIDAEPIDAMDVLGAVKGESGTSAELSDHALVYTGYERSGPRMPRGETALFTRAGLLGKPIPRLPYENSSGITYFRYWRVPKRFWGRAFMQPGIGPQRTLNKREEQISQIIDQGMPYIVVTRSVARQIKIPEGLPLELVIVPDGLTPPQPVQGVGPGQWMGDDLVRLQEAVADATGVKQVALGENPPSVTNYSQLASLKDSEATKLGPISQRFNKGLCDVSRDSLDAMRSWPAGKKLMIVGDEDELEVLDWNAQKIPDKFLIRPSSKGAQPRGVGAELAKVTDLWNAAVTAGLVMQNPEGWVEWFQNSLNAGKAQEMPDSGYSEQQHKAALEDSLMAATGTVAPVAPFDLPNIHIPEHTRKQEALSAAADAGDQHAAQTIQVIEQHKQMHMAQQQQMAAQQAISAGGGSPQSPQSPSQPQLAPPATAAAPVPGPTS